MPSVLLRSRHRRNRSPRRVYFIFPWLLTVVLVFLQTSRTAAAAHEPEDAYIDEDLLSAKVIQDIPISMIEEFSKFNDFSMILKAADIVEYFKYHGIFEEITSDVDPSHKVLELVLE